MLRFVAVLCVLLLTAYIGFMEFRSEEVGPRDSIERGLAHAVKQKDLAKDEQDLLRLQLAIIAYNSANASPPDNLSQLIPTYLDAVPINPQTKRPYRYERVNSGYVLGEKRPEVPRLLVDDAEQENTEKQIAALMGGEDGFVNPNEMKEDTFRYDPTNLRDPFVSFDFSRKRKAGGDITPLETYALGQLRLTAVLQDPDGNLKAIVEDSTGLGYTVSEGTKIGDRGGVLVSIENDKLTIVEVDSDITGKEKRRVHEMKLDSRGGP